MFVKVYIVIWMNLSSLRLLVLHCSKKKKNEIMKLHICSLNIKWMNNTMIDKIVVWHGSLCQMKTCCSLIQKKLLLNDLICVWLPFYWKRKESINNKVVASLVRIDIDKCVTIKGNGKGKMTDHHASTQNKQTVLKNCFLAR